MPKFSFKGLRVDLREGFLKALSPIYGRISYPQSLTCYNDVEAFSAWVYEVPEGSWWVEWQSFNVEGSGAKTARPLPLGKNPEGSQYLGKWENAVFQPVSAPALPKPEDPATALMGPEEN